jgi:hypothetical protein
VGNVIWFVVTVGVAALAGVATSLAMRPIRLARLAEKLARAQRDFHRQREQLEAKFIDRAAATGKPRGLRWSDVDFNDDIVRVVEGRNAAAGDEITLTASTADDFGVGVGDRLALVRPDQSFTVVGIVAVHHVGQSLAGLRHRAPPGRRRHAGHPSVIH